MKNEKCFVQCTYRHFFVEFKYSLIFYFRDFDELKLNKLKFELLIHIKNNMPCIQFSSFLTK